MAVNQEVQSDPFTYLEVCFTKQDVVQAFKDFALVNVHKFFTQKHSTSKVVPLKVLDYGCGPVLAYDISAAGGNAEVVLAEYDESYRNALQDWLDHSPSAWDWSPYIKHVVCDLEGKGDSEVLKREESLRKAIKAVVPCNITQDPPIAKGYEGPYDVVMSLLCLDSACHTRSDYKAAFKRLAGMVKNGGDLLLYTTIRNREEHDDTPGYYGIGERKVFDVALPLQFVLTTLKQNGFTVIETNQLPEEESAALNNLENTDLESAAFITASKL